MNSINIAIADDEALFRKGMKLLLSEQSEFQVNLEAENGVDLLDKLGSAEQQPDILLLDLNMPGMNGIEAAKIIRTQYPELKIIILSTHFSRAFVINMIEIGASAYLAKNTEPEEVVNTILSVTEKGFHYNDEVMNIIRDNILSKKKTKPNFPFELTSRESEILALICDQHTTPEISKKLFISPRTVDGHRNNLLSKLGCKNVAGLVVYAITHELVDLDQSGLF